MTIEMEVDRDASRIMSRVEKFLTTFQVKTASVSKAGNKVQVRVTWNNPKKLGYYSCYASHLTRKDWRPGFEAIIVEVAQITKLVERSQPHLQDPVFREVLKRLKLLEGELKELAERLHAECYEQLLDSTKDGAANRAARRANYQRAKDALKHNFIFALDNGLNEDEIKEMLNHALVEHTMKS